MAWSVRRHHPDPVIGVADGFNPIRRFPPSPAQAGCAVSTKGTGIGRSRGCARGLFWLQKSTRGTWSRLLLSGPERETGGERAGSSQPALCSGGERVSEAGSRLKTPRPGGAARRSVRSKLRQDRVASRPPPQSGRTESAGWQRVVTRPKLEVRRQAKLHLGAHRGHWPKGEPASVAAQKAREGRSVTRGSPGNWAVFGVLGSWIGCRSRTSASFSCGAARCGATRGET